jgi:hypothetical protein
MKFLFQTLFASRARTGLAALLLSVGLAVGLSGCAGPQASDYAREQPKLDMRQYFNGTLDAYGVFTDRSGKVVKRFTVVMTCSWSGPAGQETGVLDEEFSYSDGTRDRRVWTLKRTGEGRYVGTAADVEGQALGEESGHQRLRRIGLLEHPPHRLRPLHHVDPPSPPCAGALRTSAER